MGLRRCAMLTSDQTGLMLALAANVKLWRRGNSLCSPAPQLRLEPIAQRSRKWRPGLLKPAELPDVMTIQAAQLLLDGPQIDAGGFSLADDGTPIDDDIAHQRCVASREQKLQRVDSHDPIAVEALASD